jgi:hypothetical protein
LPVDSAQFRQVPAQRPLRLDYARHLAVVD